MWDDDRNRYLLILQRNAWKRYECFCCKHFSGKDINELSTKSLTQNRETIKLQLHKRKFILELLQRIYFLQ